MDYVTFDRQRRGVLSAPDPQLRSTVPATTPYRVASQRPRAIIGFHLGEAIPEYRSRHQLQVATRLLAEVEHISEQFIAYT